MRKGKSQERQWYATLVIDEIRLDFQSLESLDAQILQEYVRRIRRGEKIRAVDVRFDGKAYFLADGFHRVQAAKQVGRKTIRARISNGTLAEMEAEFQRHLARLKAELAFEANVSMGQPKKRK